MSRCAKNAQDEVKLIEELRHTSGLALREFALRSGVPLLQYLEATQGQRKLSKAQLDQLTAALPGAAA